MSSVEYNFSELLKQFRVREHLSQHELAKRMGVHRNTVVAWEQGSYLPKTRPRVLELAQVLHLNEQDTEELFHASFLSGSEEQQTSDTITSSQPTQLWNVPYRRNPYFTGREEMLNRLHETYQAEQNVTLTQPQAISGMGGIGKTQAAVEYAYRFRDDYSAVLWARAETPEVITTDLVALASLINLPEMREQNLHKVIEAVKIWFKEHDKWLLILDNVEKIAILQEFLPTEFSGHILLTTRNQVTGTFAQRIDLECMVPEEGAHFLLHRAKLLPYTSSLKNASESLLSVALTLTQKMGGLPLALDQAGAYIEETGCDIANYLYLYQSQQTKLLTLRGEMNNGHPNSVYTTLALTLEKFDHLNTSAIAFLQLCAFLHPDAISESMITKAHTELGPVLGPIASDPLSFDMTLATLRTYSLLRRNSDAKTLAIHRLTQAVLKERMDGNTQHLWAQRVVNLVDHSFPDGAEASMWSQCQSLLPQVMICLQLIERWEIITQHSGRLLNEAGVYLREQALYSQAEEFLNKARAIRIKAVGSEHPDVAQSLDDLAALYWYQGRYNDAESLYKEALILKKHLLGSEHLNTSESLNNLAILYFHLGRYKESESLYQQALKIKEKQLGFDHPNTAECMNNLAVLYRTQNRYAEAELLYQKTLAIWEQQLGPRHPDTCFALNNLGKLYRLQKRYADAELLLKRALDISIEHIGAQHPLTAHSMSNLALLYHDQNRYAEAEPLLLQALAIREQVFGSDHPQTAFCFNNLAMLYHAQGRHAQAELLLQQALKIREQHLGLDHPDVAANLHDIGIILSDQGLTDQAKLLFQRALTIREQKLGIDHPDTQTTRARLYPPDKV